MSPVNDDADGGLRGLRPQPTPALVDALATHYGLDAHHARDLGGGLNLNLLIDADGRGYVARVYRPYVTAARLAAIQHVRNEVATAGVPCAPLLRTRDGAGWVDLGGALVEVESYIDSDFHMDTPDRLCRGLPTLGRIHSALRQVEVSAAGRESRFANHVYAEQALAATAKATERIRRWTPTTVEERLAAQADELAAVVSTAEEELSNNLPRQLVHGDFWDNNVLFAGDRLVLVADFDFMAERARIDDLALTLYFADLHRPLRHGDDRIATLRSFVDAYDSGLADHLTPAERSALPWALARQPLWEIGGWVASLDDEKLARWHLGEMPTALERAHQIANNPDVWTRAFG